MYRTWIFDRCALALRSTSAVLLAAACACHVAPPPADPEAPGNELQAYATQSPELGTGAPSADWWKQLEDATLDRLVGEALATNKDLDVAVANLRAARAVLRESKSARLPSVTAGSSARFGRASGAAAGIDEKLDSTELYDLGVDASWELDFFGRTQGIVDAARAGLRIAENRLAEARLLIAADTATAYIDLRGAQERLAVAFKNRENQARTLELTQNLRGSGQGTELDVARAIAQQSTTNASIPPLEAEVDRAAFRLGVLTGRAPQDLVVELRQAHALPEPPARVDVGAPNELARRRPDVRAAESAVAGASARLAIAVAELYPRITLFGSVGFSADKLENIFDAEAFRYSSGPALSWQVFDRGALKARVREADAIEAANIARFEATVLAALEETESALSSYAHERARRGELSTAAQASTRAAELARTRFEHGADSFLTVLDAELRQLEAEDALALSDIEALHQFIVLNKALGVPPSEPAPANQGP